MPTSKETNSGATTPPTSIFTGYIPSSKKASGGKQKKALGTGFYFTKGKKSKYYIKRSEEFPADDIAEIITAGLGRSILESLNDETSALNHEDLFAECTSVTANTPSHEVFVRSTCAPNWKELYKHWGGSNFFLDMFRTLKDKKTFQIVKDLDKKQKQQLSIILATCLWLGEYDCGSQNIGKDQNGNIVKIDHGWGLVNICKKRHSIVRLFEHKDLFGTRGTHKNSGIPTNHFNDFKYLIKTPFFTDALENLIDKLKKQEKNKELHAIVNSQILNIVSTYKQQGTKAQIKALYAFTEHLGLELPEELNTNIGSLLEEGVPKEDPTDTLEKLQKTTIENITKKLIVRRKSMELTHSLLITKAKLKAFKKSQVISTELEIQTSVMQELANLKKNNKY